MKKPFKDTKVGKLLNSKGAKAIKDLVLNTAQAFPITGTIATVIKNNTKQSPSGTIKVNDIGTAELYRLAIGVGIAYVMYKGVLGMKELEFIISFLGM